LKELPELEAHNKRRDVLLAFQDDVGLALSESCAYCDAIILFKAAKIPRRQMLDRKIVADGTYNMDSTEEAIPPSLLQFVGMVEHGADIKSQLRFGAPKTDLAMAQLLQYNCYARFKEGAPTHRHSKVRETPFPIYIGLSVLANTRRRKLVEMLHANGLSISYDRVLEIFAELGDAVVAKYIGDGVVCPPELRTGLFTTSAIDNIDHNPSSTTSTTSFHGTSISLFQHPTHVNEGEKREELQVRGTKVKRVPELPDSYTNIKPAHFTNNSPPPPKMAGAGMSLLDMEILKPQMALEFEWLQKVSITEVHNSKPHMVIPPRRQEKGSCIQGLYLRSDASPARSGSLCSYSATCHGQDQRCSEVAEPRTSACDHSGSADICYSQADPVAVA